MNFADGLSPDSQPYKYNSKELDQMSGLNWYDYSARYYDPAIARFTTMDQLCEKYYSMSPYAYCGNNPVNNVDLRGDTITTVINSTITNPNGTTSIQSDSYYYGQDANGNYGFIGSNGQIYSGNDTYVNSLTTALNDLRTGGDVGKGLVSDLSSSTKTVQIAQGRNTADPNGTYIKWNPNSTNGGPDQNGGTTRPSYIGLGHEMAHTQDVWNGTYDSNIWSGNIPNAEKYSTHVENQLRAEHGLPLRTNYAITPTGAGDPSTQILLTGTRLSSFYKTTIFIGGIPVIIPYIYK